MTDGRIFRGDIITRTPFRLVTWAEDELGIDTPEDLSGYGGNGVFYRFYGRERRFDLDMVASIRLEPRPDLASQELPPERMERRWDWKYPAKHGDARETISYEKVFIGDPFPVRELQAVVTFNSGEVLAGSLTRAAIYIYPEGEPVARRLILQSKETGEPGQTLDTLHHVESIRFEEAGAMFPASQLIRFIDPRPDDMSDVWTLTRETLTPVTPEPVAGIKGTVTVSGTLGEGLFLTIFKDGVYHVGWQDRADPGIHDLARRHVAQLRDYYNERDLLGVRQVGGTRDVLTLVRLQRRVPETSVREQTPERFGLSSDDSLEFYRLAIWRWRHDAENERMLLIDRGSFFRKQLPERGAQTPVMRTCDALWLDKTASRNSEIVIDRRSVHDE